jgi:hypothetical protein
MMDTKPFFITLAIGLCALLYAFIKMLHISTKQNRLPRTVNFIRVLLRRIAMMCLLLTGLHYVCYGKEDLVRGPFIVLGLALGSLLILQMTFETLFLSKRNPPEDMALPTKATLQREIIALVPLTIFLSYGWLAETPFIPVLLLLSGLLLWKYALAYVVCASLFFIFSTKQGRMQRAVEIFKVSVRRLAAALLVVIALGYVWDLFLRIDVKNCEVEMSEQDGGLYIAELCYVNSYAKRLRLYSSRDGTLLAERTFSTYRDSTLTWWDGRLNYDSNGNAAFISLPPSWMDRMRAKLP